MKKLNKPKLRNLTAPLLALSLMLGSLGLFGGKVNAATQTITVPDSSWADAPSEAFNPGFGPSNGGFVNAGTSTGWEQDFAVNPLVSPGAAAQAMVPPCVASDITMNLSIDYEQLNPSPGGTGAGEFTAYILNQTLSMGDFIGTGNSFALPYLKSGQLNVSYTITKTQYDAEDWGFVLGFDQANDAHWRLFNRLATISYDDSACSVLPATEPDISTTPASTPVIVNILGNDTGAGLSVSKIDGQAITPGQTITLSNGSGTVKLNDDGTITFTPNSTFSGESLFSYSITDGSSTVDTGAVRITVVAATTSGTTAPTTVPANNDSTPILASTGQNVRLAIVGSSVILILGLLIKFRFARR